MQESFETDSLICGIDEAGRGPLAGPVYASAVVFKNKIGSTLKVPCEEPNFFSLLNDSKKMTNVSRTKAFDMIVQESFYAISFASHEEIDKMNILQASLLAMIRAFSLLYEKLEKEVPCLLPKLIVIVDGNKLPIFKEDVKCKALVKADEKIQEVMAASILAKVARDKRMIEYSHIYPQWNYEKHKGYPTKAHIEAIKKYGESPIQRKSFKYKL